MWGLLLCRPHANRQALQPLLASLVLPSWAHNLQHSRGAAKKAAAKGKTAAKGKKGQQQPAKKSKQRLESKPFDDKDPLMQKVIAMLVVPHTGESEWVPGTAKRVKAFSSLRMQEHRAWQHDLAVKLQLKKAALQVLPPQLRAAAMQEDLTPFPLTRHYLYDRPPDAYMD